MMPAARVDLVKEAPGYVLDRRITGPNTAASNLQIPTINGRDAMEYNFYRNDGIEYLDLAGSLYVHENAVKPIYSGNKSYVTIPASGHTRWFTVPEKAAGKTMKVKMPANSSFAVYDEKGTCINFSLISANHKVVLPEKGAIVFAGEAGTKFEISIK